MLWFAFTAVVFLGDAFTTKNFRGFFRKPLLKAIGLGAVLEFATNLTSFPFWGELTLFPLASLVVMISVVAGRDPKTHVVQVIANTLLAILGFTLIGWAIRSMWIDWFQLDFIAITRAFAAPFWLSVGVIPYIFTMALVGQYEQALLRLPRFANDRKLPWRVKAAVLLTLNVHLIDLSELSGHWLADVGSAQSFTEARRVLQTFRRRNPEMSPNLRP